jgi:pimeloyl-ACP methyl ester carboxylesterase
MGTGPAVVFVHGSLATHGDWFRVAESLADRFTCYLMDRRGHGLSGEGAGPYSIECEYDDIAAVLEAAGPGASLVAHSYGATCSLGCAARTEVARIVLYEPPLPIKRTITNGAFEQYCAALESGALEEALVIGMRSFVGLPAEKVEAMRDSSMWTKLSALAPTWPCELEAMDDLGGSVELYSGIASPTLLLLGTESAQHPFKEAVAALAKVMPHVTVASLPGQSHMALRTAPQLVTRLIAEFLS